MRTPHLFPCCVVLAAFAAAPLVQAQPPDPPIQVAAVQNEWNKLRDQTADLEATDPLAAIEGYQQFYEARGHLDRGVSIRLTSLMAQLYWRGLGDRAKALEIYNRAIPLFTDHPDSARLRRERDQLLHGTAPTAPTVQIVPLPQAPGATTEPSVPLVGVAPAATITPFGALKAVPAPALPPEHVGLAVAPVNARSAVVAALVAQMRDGRLTPEAAWQKGDWKAEEVFYALQTPGVTAVDQDAGLRAEMAGLLVKHAPEQVAPPVELSESLKLPMADYYASVKDARAVPLYRELLAQSRGPSAPAPLALHHLAAYYSAVGDFGQAADTLMRTDKFTTFSADVGVASIEAARLYHQVGDEAKAQAAYAKGAQSGHGWSVGLAAYDQASALLRAGKDEQARLLLRQPVSGPNAEAIGVALLSLLSSSYYQTGELELARRTAQQAIAQAEALPQILPGEGLEGQVERARRIVEQIALWQKTPLVAEPGEIRLIAGGEPSVIFQVITRVAVPLTASSDNSQVKVSVLSQGANQSELTFVQRVLVKVALGAMKPGFKAQLTLSSEKLPDTKVTVPLLVVEKDTFAPPVAEQAKQE